MQRIKAYFGIEALPALPAKNYTLLKLLLRNMAANHYSQPADHFHYRARNDEKAIIFQGNFPRDFLRPGDIQERLSELFNVETNQITANINKISFGPGYSAFCTFSYNSTPRLRHVIFGFDTTWPTLAESAAECRAFILANANDWDSEIS